MQEASPYRRSDGEGNRQWEPEDGKLLQETDEEQKEQGEPEPARRHAASQRCRMLGAMRRKRPRGRVNLSSTSWQRSLENGVFQAVPPGSEEKWRQI